MTELHVTDLNIRKSGQHLVKDVSFSLKPGELVVMLGPNGAGKSLTLEHAIGLERPMSGSAVLQAQDIYKLAPTSRARALTYMPQTPELAWPILVRDLVALGRFAYGARLGKLSGADAEAITRAMHACDISHLATRKATTLSGGELARTHCARAIAAESPLLIADEPVAALDPHYQFAVMDLFHEYVRKGGGALIVLHDIALASQYADRLIWMKNGRIIASGSPEDTVTPERLAQVYHIKADVTGRRVIINGRL